MARFRSRVVEIEAFQWTGGPDQTDDPLWIIEAVKAGRVTFDRVRGTLYCWIKTLEGTMRAQPGDWIIKGTEGELYPCKPSIFERKYEAVEEPVLDRKIEAAAIQFEWIWYCELGSPYEQRMSKQRNLNDPIRHQHRKRGAKRWKEGRPPA